MRKIRRFSLIAMEQLILKNYVYKIEDFEFQPGIFDLIQSYQKEGYLIFIITNQSGIAREIYSENDYLQLTDWMLGQFSKKGIIIEKVYHCPHHPGITGPCLCRKPRPGMILEAIETFSIDPKQSVLIGNNERDLQAGQSAGIGKNLYIQHLLRDIKKQTEQAGETFYTGRNTIY